MAAFRTASKQKNYGLDPPAQNHASTRCSRHECRPHSKLVPRYEVGQYSAGGGRSRQRLQRFAYDFQQREDVAPGRIHRDEKVANTIPRWPDQQERLAASGATQGNKGEGRVCRFPSPAVAVAQRPKGWVQNELKQTREAGYQR